MMISYLEAHPEEFQNIMAGVYHLGESAVKELLTEAQQAGKKLDFYFIDTDKGVCDKITYQFI